jgi:poly-gamma-glutamate synthesis protein (capsule biosynthesis protein)
VVSVANNHAGDYGRFAFVDMLSRLDAAGIGYFGGGANIARAYAPQVVLIGDLKVALIGVSNIETPYFAATETQAGIAWADDAQIVASIETARTLADVVIVMPHWGWEYTQIMSSEQQRLARLMVDAGADAVIGSHPHHIQKTEEYQGKIIAYSLGNFIFEGIGPNPGWSLGELIQINIGEDKHIIGSVSIPYHISVSGVATPL